MLLLLVLPTPMTPSSTQGHAHLHRYRQSTPYSPTSQPVVFHRFLVFFRLPRRAPPTNLYPLERTPYHRHRHLVIWQEDTPFTARLITGYRPRILVPKKNLHFSLFAFDTYLRQQTDMNGISRQYMDTAFRHCEHESFAGTYLHWN